MSTTIKRIALVAVAALSLGVVTSVPSNAAPSAAYTNMVDTTLGQQEIGGLATVTLTLDSNTVTTIAVTGVGSVLSIAAGANTTTTSGSAALATWTDSVSAVANGSNVVVLTSAVAGTQTITMTPLNADGTRGTAVTKAVTWVTTASKNTYANAAAFIAAGEVSGRVIADSTTAELSVNSAIDTTAERATISIMQFSPVDTTTVSTLVAGKGKTAVVTISGAGILGKALNTPTGASVSYSSNTTLNTDDKVYVFSDGRVGPASITITVDGKLVATKSVSFYGAVASYAASTTEGATLSSSYLSTTGVGNTATVTIVGKDAAGVVMAPGAIHVTSDTTTVATVTRNDTTKVVTITGVGVGKTNINVCNTASCTDATIKYSFPIEVTKSTAAKVAVAFDAASYTPGAKMTITVTATDSNGRPVADGARVLFADTFTANVQVTGALPAQAPVLKNGVATFVAYAPAGSGDIVITGKEGTATDSTTKADITASTSVTNPGVDAALDAANEAATAAQDATDAAIQAADAADEATAAVAALSLEVNTLIAGLKKQLVTLTNLVKNLQKAVAAKK